MTEWGSGGHGLNRRQNVVRLGLGELWQQLSAGPNRFLLAGRLE